RRKEQHVPAAAVEQERERRMVDEIGLRIRRCHFLEEDLVSGSDASYFSLAAGQRHDARMKCRSVAAQQLSCIACRIERNENGLHVFATLAERPEGLRNDEQISRADIGAEGIAEVKQHHLAAKIGETDALAVRVRERERPAD